MDDTGRIIREVKVASEPEALLEVLRNPPGTSSGSDWKPGRCWCTRRAALPWLPPRRAAQCSARYGRLRYNRVWGQCHALVIQVASGV